MQTFPSTFIWRHRKENLKKCSLQGLQHREDISFFSYPNQALPPLNSYVILSPEASQSLSIKDQDKGLLILDATWRYAYTMKKNLPITPSTCFRYLPETYQTAYPRKAPDCLTPSRNLASVEALFLSYYILERPVDGLLTHYYWKNNFLEKNFSSPIKTSTSRPLICN